MRTHMMRILRGYDIDTVIDVGANEGGFGRYLRSIGFTGEIFSFEPVRTAFEKLSAVSAGDPAWTAFDVALGSSRGEATINVSKFSQLSSMLPASDYGSRHCNNMEIVEQQKISIRTLDECRESGLIPSDRRFLLKMDTQGFDLEVFRGASATLPQVRCMLSELSLIPIYEGMPHYLEALALYERSGFAVTGFYPISRNRENLALNEVDCLMVNTKYRLSE